MKGKKEAPPPVRETESGKENQRMKTQERFYHSAGRMSTEARDGL